MQTSRSAYDPTSGIHWTGAPVQSESLVKIKKDNTKMEGLRHTWGGITITINKKYVLWNVYLPNVVAVHTPLSKYLTAIVMTLN